MKVELDLKLSNIKLRTHFKFHSSKHDKTVRKRIYGERKSNNSAKKMTKCIENPTGSVIHHKNGVIPNLKAVAPCMTEEKSGKLLSE